MSAYAGKGPSRTNPVSQPAFVDTSAALGEARYYEMVPALAFEGPRRSEDGGSAGVTIAEEPIAGLALHGEVSIAFLVERVLVVTLVEDGLGGVMMSERALDVPWVKDYDAIKGEGPTRWPRRFDVTNWGLISAHDGDRRVGGAVVAFNTADVSMLEGRGDLAVLWDIRVDPSARLSGIGSLLFRAVEAWARDRRCRTLKIETRNTNVPACRFYQRMGCKLGAIDRFAYADLPDEIQLMWFKEL